MKKIVSLLLTMILLLSALALTGCGAINDSDVAILWQGDGEVKSPNSLINSMERAMYIENISYKHYGANNSAGTQVDQAKIALNAGASALLVELVGAFNTTFAQQIVDAAKEKGVPVIFFNCIVSSSIIDSYDKCILVTSNHATIADVQGQVIADYVLENFKNIDKNKDGKISYVAYGTGTISTAAVKKANELLATEDYVVKTADRKKINTSIAFYDANNLANTLSPSAPGAAQLAIMAQNETAAELIVTENDFTAYEVLCALQSKGYNTDKLTTHCIPVFTVGEDLDYKSIVLNFRPELPENLIIKDTDSDKDIKNKNKEIKKLAELQAYYEANKYRVDLTTVDESDLGEMVYTTINVIDTGRLAGTATVDNDSIAATVAEITRNFIKSNDVFKNVDKSLVSGSIVAVPYKAYPN